MTRFLPFVASIAAVLALAKPCLAADITVVDALVTAPIIATAKTAAAMLTLKNSGDSADRLLKVETPSAEMAQIHKTTEKDSVLHMEAVESLDLPAGGSIDLAAEHMHIMLMGLRTVLQAGDKVKFTLTLEKAGAVEVDALVIVAP